MVTLLPKLARLLSFLVHLIRICKETTTKMHYSLVAGSLVGFYLGGLAYVLGCTENC